MLNADTRSCRDNRFAYSVAVNGRYTVQRRMGIDMSPWLTADAIGQY